MQSATLARAGGRPRRAGISAAVLMATADLVSQQGVPRTTLDDIASRAGVAKTTLYRRWPSKGALAVDALAHVLGEVPVVAVPTDAGLREAVAWLVSRMRQAAVADLLSGVVAEAAHDPELRRLLRERIRDPFTTRLSTDWDLAPADVDRAFDIVVGSLVHRHAMNGEITDIDIEVVTSVATLLLFGRSPVAQDL